MGSIIGTIFGVFSDLFSMIANYDKVKKTVKKYKGKKWIIAGAVILGIIICAALIVHFVLSSAQYSITVTQVVLSDDSLSLREGESKTLAATVLYSDNSKDNTVLWVSSNEAVASVGSDGVITALSAGSTTITAQAVKNNTTESAECTVTVKGPPSGYSISVTPTMQPSYFYIHVEPYDHDITHIQIHALSPSGTLYSPQLDENDLYHFYAETGTWTVYAYLESEGGVYEANRPEDFVSIEVTAVP